MPAPLRRPIVILGVLLAFATGGCHATSPGAVLSTVSVSGSPGTRPVPDGFLGLALEYNTLPQWAGTANPVLVQLVRNLQPAGRPVLRIGGQSTDRTWWPVRGVRRPLGITFNLTPRWMAQARALAQATGARLMLGINLEAGRRAITDTEAAQLTRIGRAHIDSLQIGNEPDLYRFTPWYRVVGGRPVPWYSHAGIKVFSRPPDYGPAQFTQEFGRALKAMPSGMALSGPETGIGEWLQAFRTFLSPRSRVRMLTVHAYGLNQCVHNPSSPVYPSVPNLLSTTASRGEFDGLSPYVGIAHHDGATVRIDEMGSITCNGRAGVSNTMASALWALDALFSAARTGIDGVNVHSYPWSANGLFDFTRSHGSWRATVHPIYYGVLMFAEAAPEGSRLLGIGSSGPAYVRSWATLGPDHHVRVVLINSSMHDGARDVVRAPAGFGAHPAAIARLRARSAYATGSVSLGGRSFGPSTPTGVLAAPVRQTVASAGGRYTVTLPPASAALLTLAPR